MMTQIDFYKKYNLNRGGVSALVTGSYKSVSGWRLNEVRVINSRKLSDSDIGLMKEDYLSGLTIEAVAKKYKVARNTAYERLKEAGLKNRGLSEAFKLKKRGNLNCNELMELYNKGYSTGDLSAKYSISVTSIRNIIKDYSGQYRTPWETRRLKQINSIAGTLAIMAPFV